MDSLLIALLAGALVQLGTLILTIELLELAVRTSHSMSATSVTLYCCLGCYLRYCFFSEDGTP